MTTQQRTALAHPCFLGMETSHPRYGKVVPPTSRVLTVDAGYE